MLLGGGHGHLEVLRRFGADPVPGARVTLVSRQPVSVYSGMVPGFVAGHYRREQLEIDLARLCSRVGARFVCGEVTGVDAAAGGLRCASGQALAYDVLSVCTGAVAGAVPGVAEHAVAVAPLDRFARRWSAARLTRGARIAVVGGGASGVELAAALAWCRRDASVSIVTAADRVLPEQGARVQRRVERALAARAIAVRCSHRVVAVEAGALVDERGARTVADLIVWAAGARAPGWPADAGLATDASGFIAVDSTLRSTSHPNVFAAGDIASVVDARLPRAGVVAVRQGPVLADNLRAAATGAQPRRFEAPREFLAILALGDRTAIAAWRRRCLEGRAMWRLKDAIDRRFVARYRAG